MARSRKPLRRSMTNDALLAFPFLPTLWKKRGASTPISLTTAEVTDSMFGAAGLLTRSWVSSNSQHPARYIGLPHIFADSVRYTRHTCHRGDIRAEKRSTWIPLPLDDRLGIYNELSALESVFTYRPPAMTLAANQSTSQLVIRYLVCSRNASITCDGRGTLRLAAAILAARSGRCRASIRRAVPKLTDSASRPAVGIEQKLEAVAFKHEKSLTDGRFMHTNYDDCCGRLSFPSTIALSSPRRPCGSRCPPCPGSGSGR